MLSTIRRLIVRLLRRATDNEIRKRLDAQDFEGALDMVQRLPPSMRHDPVAQQYRVDALIGMERFAEALNQLAATNTADLPEVWKKKFDRLKWRTLYSMGDFDALAGSLADCAVAHSGTTSFLAYKLLAASHLGDHEAVSETSEELMEKVDLIDEPWQFIALYSAFRWLDESDRETALAAIARAVPNRYPS